MENAFLAHVDEQLSWVGMQNANNIMYNAGFNSELHVGGVLSSYASAGFTKRDLLDKMVESKMFVILAHGNAREEAGKIIGKNVLLDGLGHVFLETEDIYDFETDECLDLSNSEVVIFLGCQTANHPTESLPEAAFWAGADYAIGFLENIKLSGANAWIEAFAESYVAGFDIEESAWAIAYDIGENSGDGSGDGSDDGSDDGSEDTPNNGISSIEIYCN